MELLSWYGRNEILLGIIAINSILALSMYITLKAGAWAVGHPAFVAIGAYASTIISFEFGLPLPVGILTGIALAALLAGALARPLLRLENVYLAVASIALIQIVYVLALNLTDLTKGNEGINGITPAFQAWHLLLILALLALLFWRFDGSRFGLALNAVREGVAVARSTGIDPGRVRLHAFVVGAALAATAGILHAWTRWTVHPGEFTFPLLVQIMSFVILGGIARFWGPILGATFLTLLPEALHYTAPYIGSMISGLVVVGVLVLFPGGLAGLVLRTLDEVSPRLRVLRRIPTERPRTSGAAALRLLRPPAADRHDGAAQNEVLRVDDVIVRFGGVVALDRVSLRVGRGITGLIGPNGSGKTTLLNVISGVQRAHQGRVVFSDRDITQVPASGRARLGIARTFQGVRTFRQWSLEDNVALGRANITPRLLDWVRAIREGSSGLHALRTRSRAELDAVGLGTRAQVRASSLPFGLQHRLELARCIAQQPTLLLLDEPSTGMSRAEWEELAEVLQLLRQQGVAIVLVEHNIELVRLLCDRLVVLNFGRKIADGAPDSVRRDPSVISAYLGSEEEEHVDPVAR